MRVDARALGVSDKGVGAHQNSVRYVGEVSELANGALVQVRDAIHGTEIREVVLLLQLENLVALDVPVTKPQGVQLDEL